MNKKEKKKKIKICPKCKSKGIILESGGITGKYKCKDCGYFGVLVLEKFSK